MVLGASNLWFGVTASALHLPHGQTVEDIVAAHWNILGAQPSADVAQAIIDGMDALRGLRGHPDPRGVGMHREDPRRGRARRRAGGRRTCGTPSGSCCPGPRPSGRTPTSAPYPDPQPATATTGCSTRSSWSRRLREVRALVGFTRLAAPERGDLQPVRRVPLTRGATEWVPAVEQRGEGIFLQLREDAVARWAAGGSRSRRLEALRAAYQRWAADRDQAPRPGFPDRPVHAASTPSATC